jgi:hypothetical protein
MNSITISEGNSSSYGASVRIDLEVGLYPQAALTLLNDAVARVKAALGVMDESEVNS